MATDKNSEQAKSSVDDMIGRLKEDINKSHGVPDGELITRPDGTQVIKARKRKRRSKQPHKEEAKKRLKNIIIAASCVTALGIAFVVGIFIILAKYNSNGFKESCQDNIQAVTSAQEVKMQRVTITPASGKIGSIEASWPDGSVLDKVEFKQITSRFRLSTFFGKKWNSDELRASKGTIHLQSPTGAKPPASESFNPFAFDFYRSFSTDIFFGSSTKGIAFRDAQCSFNELYDTPQSVIQNATLQHPFWPRLKISNVLIKHHAADKVDINGVIISESHNSSMINLSGVLNPYSAEETEFEAKINQFPIQEMLGNGKGQGLDRLITGLIQAPLATIEFNPAKPASIKVEAAFESDYLKMEGFTFLRTLRRELGQSWYDKPIFNRASGSLTIEDGNIQLENLSLIATDKLHIRGSIICSNNKQLSGHLQIGIPAIEHSARPEGFTSPSNGYYWAEIDLRGTSARPDDTLFELMGSESSSSETTVPSQPASKAANPAFSFDELTE